MFSLQCVLCPPGSGNWDKGRNGAEGNEAEGCREDGIEGRKERWNEVASFKEEEDEGQEEECLSYERGRRFRSLDERVSRVGLQLYGARRIGLKLRSAAHH